MTNNESRLRLILNHFIILITLFDFAIFLYKYDYLIQSYYKTLIGSRSADILLWVGGQGINAGNLLLSGSIMTLVGSIYGSIILLKRTKSPAEKEVIQTRVCDVCKLEINAESLLTFKVFAGVNKGKVKTKHAPCGTEILSETMTLEDVRAEFPEFTKLLTETSAQEAMMEQQGSKIEKQQLPGVLTKAENS